MGSNMFKIPLNKYPVFLLPTLLTLIVFLALALTSCSSVSRINSLIVAKQVSDVIPLDPDDSAWNAIEPTEITVYPQSTVTPVDKNARKNIMVQVLYNEKELALRLKWKDETKETVRDIGQFPDAVAVQWPVIYGSGKKLPYLGMGDPEHPVTIWFRRADGTTETLAAKGFGSLTANAKVPTTAPNGIEEVEAKSLWKDDGTWVVVFKRALQSGNKNSVSLQPGQQALVPLALAVWDGKAEQRNGKKLLSGWQILYFKKGKVDSTYVKQLTATPPVKGDSERGKRLVNEKSCTVCHAFPGKTKQPTVGPGLAYIGIHRPEYLLESIMKPSKVIVPGKGFAVLVGGRSRSLMPPFQGTEQESYDIVEFLKTLR